MSSFNSSTNRKSVNLKLDALSETQDDSKIIQFSKNFCHNVKSETIINKIACYTCSNISTIPKMCSSCNTVYCYYCSKKYTADKINKCPKCKKSLNLLKLNNELNETLKNLKIRCLNNVQNDENTCKEILNWSDLLDHFTTCNYSKGYAKCMGCEKEGLYEEIITHTYLCEEVILKCPICSEKIKKKFYDSHEKKCQETVIQCSVCYLDCKAVNFEEHKSKDLCLVRKIEEMQKEFHSKIQDLTNVIKEKDHKLDSFAERLRILENEKSDKIIDNQDNINQIRDEDVEFKKKIIENHKKFNNEINNLKDNIFQIKSNINEIQGKLDDKSQTNPDNRIFIQSNDNLEKSFPKRILDDFSNHLNKINSENLEAPKIKELKCIKSIEAHSSVIYNLKKLKIKINNKNAIASAGGDNLIKIWDQDDFKTLATLEGHSDQILSFCELKKENNNKSFLLSAGEDKKIILWDLSELKLVKIFENPIHSNRIWRILNFKNYFNDANFSDCIISCGDDKTIKVFNYKTEKLIARIDNGNDKLTCLLQYNTFKEKYNQANKNNNDFKNMHFLISGDTGRKLKLWKLNYSKKNNNSDIIIEAQLMKNQEFHTNYVSEIQKIKWKKDFFTIASASADETIKIINLATFSCLFTLKGHVDRIYCLAPIYLKSLNSLNDNFSNSEKVYLASGGKDKTIKIWDLQSGGVLINTLKDHEDNIRSLLVLKNKTLFKTKNNNDVNMNEFTLLSAGSDSLIKIWSS